MYHSERIVPPEGPKTAKIALIGEAPGRVEDETGRPFSNKEGAGRLLDRLLVNAGLSREEVWITNVLKRRPLGNDITPFFGQVPKKEALTRREKGEEVYEAVSYTEGGEKVTYFAFSPAGRDWVGELRAELAALPGLRVVIPTGNTALAALLGKVGILNLRGSPFHYGDNTGNVWCLPTLHPAACIGGRMFHGRYWIESDLRKARLFSEGKALPLERNLRVDPIDSTEALSWLAEVGRHKERFFDIECDGGQNIQCLSFSWTPAEGICIPLLKSRWDPEPRRAILNAIEELTHPSPNDGVTLAAQNSIFDTFMLEDKLGFAPFPEVEDPGYAHSILYPFWPWGLAFLNSLYTTEPYYKDEGKQWRKVTDFYKFQAYCAKDSCTGLENLHAIHPMLAKKDADWAYERTKAVVPALREMMHRGFRVDGDGLAAVRVALREEVGLGETRLALLMSEKLRKMAQSWLQTYPGETDEDLLRTAKVGREPLLTSSTQLASYFYDKPPHGLGLPEVKNFKTGSRTTDDKALTKLTKRGISEAVLIQSQRSATKLLTTYAEMSLSSDGRFRCAYKPRGTYGGRFSTEAAYDGTGGNHQNLHTAFTPFLGADEGYILVEIDGDNAEGRVTAYSAEEPVMMKAFEDGVKLHAFTASQMTGLSVEQVLEEYKLLGKVTDAGELEERRRSLGFLSCANWLPRSSSAYQCGKRSNHGFGYGMRPPMWAHQYESSIEDAEAAFKRWHATYPGIQRWWGRVEAQLREIHRIENCFGRVVPFKGPIDEDLVGKAIACGPQSTVVDWTNTAMLEVRRQAGGTNDLHLLRQCHDALTYQVRVGKPTGRVIESIVDIMGAPVLVLNGRSFKIPASAKIGFNLGEYSEPDPERGRKGNPLGLRDYSPQALQDLLGMANAA